jgi:hypothetical protein
VNLAIANQSTNRSESTSLTRSVIYFSHILCSRLVAHILFSRARSVAKENWDLGWIHSSQPGTADINLLWSSVVYSVQGRPVWDNRWVHIGDRLLRSSLGFADGTHPHPLIQFKVQNLQLCIWHLVSLTRIIRMICRLLPTCTEPSTLDSIWDICEWGTISPFPDCISSSCL